MIDRKETKLTMRLTENSMKTSLIYFLATMQCKFRM